MKYPIVSTILIAVFSVGCNGQEWDDSYKLDFSYDSTTDNGPDAWNSVQGIGGWDQYENLFIGQIGNRCGDDVSRPSPLIMEQAEGCQDIHELLTRQIADSDCTQDDIIFDITPYSLRASYPLSDDTCERPTLTLSGRFDPYAILWMELHARSEHVVEGKQYDAELQMVHMGTGRDIGQLLTVSLMIDASATQDDLEFEWMLQQWTEVAERESETCDGRGRRLRKASDYKTTTTKESYKATPSDTTENAQRKLQFSPSPCNTDRFGNGCEPLGPRRRMYPYSLWQSIWYYGYTGSLTAPPCTDLVQWRILDEPMRISRRQYKVMTTLLTKSRDDSCKSDTATSPTGENNRPLQERNESFQRIFHCTPDDFGYYVYEADSQ